MSLPGWTGEARVWRWTRASTRRTSTPRDAWLRLIVAAVAVWIGGVQPEVAAAQRRRATRRERVQVVDVAADRAYLSEGTEHGLRPGAQVRFGRRRYRVIRASSSYAVLDLAGDRLDVGERGVARVRRDALDGEETAPLPVPAPVASYRGMWPDATLPADEETPEPVPLGGDIAADRHVPFRAALGAGVSTVIGLGEERRFARAQLRARLYAQPFESQPFTLDVDAAFQAWMGDFSGRDGRFSRPWVAVRALELGYGDPSTFGVALGRLRYAAATLGMLDGARVRTPPIKGITVSAFGGLVPDPLDGRPRRDVSRFGGEVRYEDVESEWRPSVSLVAHGSTFEGYIDERRLSGTAGVFPRFGSLTGYFELAMFDESDPWQANRVELTALGLGTTLELGPVDIGGRFDMRKPERSRWLAAQLPPGWFCATEAQGDATDPDLSCASAPARYVGQVDAGLRLERFQFRAGGSVLIVEHGDAAPPQGTAFLHGRMLDVLGGHLDLTLSTALGGILERHAAQLGAALPLARDRLDLRVRYRVGLHHYRAVADPFVQHLAGADLVWTPLAAMDVSLGADVTAGGDVGALWAYTNVTWRL